jgi:hypothetical protein
MDPQAGQNRAPQKSAAPQPQAAAPKPVSQPPKTEAPAVVKTGAAS